MTVSRIKVVVAALLTAGLLGSAVPPAQAQSFQFGFGIGSGDDGFFERRRLLRPCIMTDRQLRRTIRERGYTDIFLNVANNNRIQVRATRGDWVYLLRVNTCTGRIIERERLRPA
jgi:hypothetical protein